MKKTFALLLLLTICIGTGSCKKNSVDRITACDVKDPANNLPWLKKMLEEDKAKNQDQFLIVKAAEFKGQTVFNYQLIWMSCLACVNFDCEGKPLDIGSFTQDERNELSDAIFKHSRVVFKGKSAM